MRSVQLNLSLNKFTSLGINIVNCFVVVVVGFIYIAGSLRLQFERWLRSAAQPRSCSRQFDRRRARIDVVGDRRQQRQQQRDRRLVGGSRSAVAVRHSPPHSPPPPTPAPPAACSLPLRIGKSSNSVAQGLIYLSNICLFLFESKISIFFQVNK